MDLLQSYVKAIRRYLPRAPRDDIVAEPSEELRSEIEAREADLDRPLGDHEQMAVFKAYGDPMIVARRYRQTGMSLSIGWELIGPELFPMYLIILGLNITRILSPPCGPRTVERRRQRTQLERNHLEKLDASTEWL